MDCASTSRDSAKWMIPLDSARRIGISTFFGDILTVVGAYHHCNPKNSKIGLNFRHNFVTRAAIAKRMVPSDSACRIGVSTLSREVLIVDQGVCRWRFKNRDLGNVFNYCERTDRDTDKRMIPSDSAHQIGLFIHWREDLTVDEGVCG